MDFGESTHAGFRILAFVASAHSLLDVAIKVEHAVFFAAAATLSGGAQGTPPMLGSILKIPIESQLIK